MCAACEAMPPVHAPASVQMLMCAGTYSLAESKPALLHALVLAHDCALWQADTQCLANLMRASPTTRPTLQ